MLGTAGGLITPEVNLTCRCDSELIAQNQRLLVRVHAERHDKSWETHGRG